MGDLVAGELQAAYALTTRDSRKRRRSNLHVLTSSEDRVCALVHAFVPPSTARFEPVMYEDSGAATNATGAATSSTRP